MSDGEQKQGSEKGATAPRPSEHASVDESQFATSKVEFIHNFFKRASEFTEELLRENERLRYRVLELESQVATRPAQAAPAAGAVPSLGELLRRIQELEQERQHILSRTRDIESANVDFQDRYRDIERENNNLANLYVASFQLHSTLELREVRQVIIEILLNLVGAKVFAVLLLDEQERALRPLAIEGMDPSSLPQLDPPYRKSRIWRTLVRRKRHATGGRAVSTMCYR